MMGRGLFAVVMAAAIGTGIACTGGPSTGEVLPSSGGTSTSSSGLASSSGTSGASSSSGGPKGPTNISDTGYSKACAIDDDCVPVFFGNTCGFCNGSNAVIAESAQSSYQSAYNAARANCPPQTIAGTCARPNTIVRCNTGSSTCDFVTCPGNNSPTDAHHCADAGL